MVYITKIKLFLYSTSGPWVHTQKSISPDFGEYQEVLFECLICALDEALEYCNISFVIVTAKSCFISPLYWMDIVFSDGEWASINLTRSNSALRQLKEVKITISS